MPGLQYGHRLPVGCPQAVFDDKKLTMQELLDALECNFEGKEDVRKIAETKMRDLTPPPSRPP